MSEILSLRASTVICSGAFAVRCNMQKPLLAWLDCLHKDVVDLVGDCKPLCQDRLITQLGQGLPDSLLMLQKAQHTMQYQHIQQHIWLHKGNGCGKSASPANKVVNPKVPTPGETL